MIEPHDPIMTVDSPPSVASGTVDHAGGSVSTDGSQPAGDAAASPLPAVPGYRVLSEIARGGMGRVLAALDLSLDRDVALKVLLPGATTDRFVRESKITARLSHPGIPPVHALGMLADGSPFLAMKLIAGQTLSDEIKTADRPRLLQAFLQVCQAVGFAHSRGVIHRDLKPSNVMVGAFGEVQVMDWGLAKDLSDGNPPTEPRVPVRQVDSEPTRTIDYAPIGESTDDRTRAGQVMGTPTYMAPEQARGEATDVRADVFALGGILCAILTGRPPFTGKSSAENVQRAAAGDLTETLARLDGCEADPDLIGICRRCLSANPTDRPADGQAVADAITAYLNGVQQRLHAAEIAGAEAIERSKAERRTRRIQLIAASLLLLVLAGGIVGTTIGIFKAKRATEQAQFAEGEMTKRADELQKVVGFQDKLLQLDPAAVGVKLMADLRARHAAALEKSKEPDAEKAARNAAFERELQAVNATDAAVTLIDRTVLAPAVRTIDAQFADQPLVDAALRTTLGSVYQKLGRPADALALHQRAYARRKELLGEDHPDTLASSLGVGEALGELQKLPEAERTIRAVLTAYERILGADNQKTLNAKSHLALQMRLQGKYDECEALGREIVDRYRRVSGPEHEDTLAAMKSYGRYLILRGKYPDAVKVLREVLAVQRRVADADVAGTLAELGSVLNREREWAAAEPCLREALQRNRRALGDDHPTTVTDIHNLAVALMDMGKLTEAESLARESLEKRRRSHGAEHAETLASMNVMGQVLYRQNKYAETEPYYREALETGRRVLGEDHPDTIIWIANMGFLLQRMGRLPEAETYLREAVDKNRRQMGETHPYTLTITTNLYEVLQQLRKRDEAETLMRGTLDSLRRLERDDHPAKISFLRLFVDCLRQQRKLGEAETISRELLEGARRLYGEEHAETLACLGLLGSVLRDERKLAEAEPYFQQAMETTRRLYGAEHANTLTAILRMGSLRVAQGKYAEALAVLTPMKGKVTQAIPGPIGVLRDASLKALIGKAQAGLAKEPADFALAEANLLDAHATFLKARGDKDVETREWVRALADLYAAWVKIEPGKGYDAKAAEWNAKLQQSAGPPQDKK